MLLMFGVIGPMANPEIARTQLLRAGENRFRFSPEQTAGFPAAPIKSWAVLVQNLKSNRKPATFVAG